MGVCDSGSGGRLEKGRAWGGDQLIQNIKKDVKSLFAEITSLLGLLNSGWRGLAMMAVKVHKREEETMALII